MRDDTTPNSRRRPEYCLGCLLGGAVGDALGAPIEFMSLREIRARFGAAGLRAYAPAFGRPGAITDDTQMTLFTAEGLLRADNRLREQGIAHTPSLVHQSYLRWLLTQGQRPHGKTAFAEDGWLLDVRGLHSQRAPGMTCLSALRSGQIGAAEQPINDSKGCGGVMRVAPAGLARTDPAAAFELAAACAAITHTHPSGYLSAGHFAAVLAALIGGESLPAAIAQATALLRRQPRHEECLTAVDAALKLAAAGLPTAELVESLGGGWVGEEALAIALCCALVARDFEHGVLLAVNHGGDSDSTGSLTGQLLGALWGCDAIPGHWLDGLELRAEIKQVSLDLYAHFGDPSGFHAADPEADWRRYPGW